MRRIKGCVSALIVIWVKALVMLPSASCHSRHSPATQNSDLSRMPIAVRSARPLS